MAPVRAPTLEKPSPGTHSLVYKTNSTFIVSTIIDLRFFSIDHTAFPQAPYKLSPSIKNIFTRTSFFSNSSNSSNSGACERKFFSNSLFVHSIVCAITHLFLNGFQLNFYQHFSHVCPTCYTIFSLQKALEFICDGLLHCRLTVTITWTPSYDLHKFSDTQSILMYHSVLKVLKKSRA